MGTVVGGRFRLRSVEHRSGMSTVYLAADERSGGTAVALKEFSAAGLPPEERGEALVWLTREAGLLSTLDHPRLPRLLAAFSEGDRHYLAMPFLHGQTLEELVQRKGPQDEAQVLRWGAQLAHLLRYLHTQDPPVIHRDLKPANVLLKPDGSLVLLDLGVARTVERAPGTAIGTPGYAPPEQYQGLADEASDLYALGATMHRLLTGYDPEKGEPFRQPPVRDLVPAVNKDTAALVTQLLQLAPADRPSGALAAAGQIERTAQQVESRVILPIHRMYGQILQLLALGGTLGILIYFGVLGGVAYSDFSLAFIAPTLLALLPLRAPQVEQAIRQHPEFAEHRRRVTQLFLRSYILLFVVRLPGAPWLPALIALALIANWLAGRYRETDPAHLARQTARLTP